jgi:hypothetical protein
MAPRSAQKLSPLVEADESGRVIISLLQRAASSPSGPPRRNDDRTVAAEGPRQRRKRASFLEPGSAGAIALTHADEKDNERRVCPKAIPAIIRVLDMNMPVA